MADKEVSLRLGLDAVKAKSNLREFREEFEATLRAAGSSDTEITAIKRMVRDVEAGRVSINSLSESQQAMWRQYAAGAEVARDKDAIGIKSHAALRAEVERISAAYDRLAKSGRLSDTELSQAAAQSKAKIAALNAEISKGSAAAVNAGRAMQDAFGVVGVRSANQIQAEIREIDAALRRLALDTKVSGQEFDRAWASGQSRISALQAEMNGTAAAAGGVGKSMAGIGGIAASIGPQLAAAFSAKAFIDVNVQMEATRRALTLLSGGQQQAAKEMDYLKATANRLGMELDAASRAYISLYASTKGTALEGEQTRKVFESITTAMGMLGKSSAETERALAAVSQMASKGTVQMEELKGQLGEALPGAMKAAADGMGVTVQRLMEMVESGDVLAKDLLPKMADGLNKLYATRGNIEGFAASWARMKNQIVEVFDRIGQSGAMSGLTAIMDKMTTASRLGWEAFEALGKSAGVLASSVVNLSSPLEGLRDIITEAGKRSMLAGDNFWLSGKALDALRRTVGLTQAEIDKLNGVQAAGVPVAAQAATSAQSHAVSTKGLADTLRDAAEAAEAAVKASQTLAEAQKLSGANAVMVARMYGTEAEVRRVVNLEAEKYAESMAKSAADVEQVLTAKQLLLAQLEAEAAASKDVSAKKKEEIEKLTEQVGALEATAQKTRELAEAAKMAAQQSQLSADTFGDQSARIKEYGEAVDAAREKLFQLEKQQGAGINVDEEARQAKIELGLATQRYRDALSDATQAASLHVQQLQQTASLEQKQLSVVKDRYQAIYEVAKAQGREGEAAQAMQQIRRIEIQMQEAQAKASRAQADAIIAAAKARQAELEASGQLTEAAKAEINARIQEAEVKKLDAEHAEILAKKLRDLSEATTELRQKGSGAADGLGESLNRAASSSDRLNESLRRRPGVGGGGGGGGDKPPPSGGGRAEHPSNETGSGASLIKNDWGIEEQPDRSSNVGVYGDLGTDPRQVALRLGLKGKQIEAFIEYYNANIDAENAAAYSGGINQAAHSTGYDPGVGAFKRIKKQAEEYARRQSSSTMPASEGGASGGSSTSHSVTITLPSGKSQTINAASAEDARGLSAFLQQLGTAQSTSSLRF